MARVIVLEVRPARYMDQRADGLGESVYVPILVRVVASYAGELQTGSTLVLRALGGTAEGVRFETNMAPSADVKSVGAEFIVFGSDPTFVADEESPALTPSGWFAIRGDHLVDRTLAAMPPDAVEDAGVSLSVAESLMSNR